MATGRRSTRCTELYEDRIDLFRGRSRLPFRSRDRRRGSSGTRLRAGAPADGGIVAGSRGTRACRVFFTRASSVPGLASGGVCCIRAISDPSLACGGVCCIRASSVPSLVCGRYCTSARSVPITSASDGAFLTNTSRVSSSSAYGGFYCTRASGVRIASASCGAPLTCASPLFALSSPLAAGSGTAGGCASVLCPRGHDLGTVRGHCQPHVDLDLKAGWEARVVSGG